MQIFELIKRMTYQYRHDMLKWLVTKSFSKISRRVKNSREKKIKIKEESINNITDLLRINNKIDWS